jgi:hypothetical protein
VGQPRWGVLSSGGLRDNWQFATNTSDAQVTPLVVDGLMYFNSLRGADVQEAVCEC